MFKDAFLGKSGFRSKHVKPRSDGGCDARPVALAASEAQTVGQPTDAEAQTETVATSGAGKHKSGGATAAEIEAENVEKTRDFLASVGPFMLRELGKSGKQSALFAGFERYLEASSDTEITKLHALRFDFDTYFKPPVPVPAPATTQRGSEQRKAAKPSSSTAARLGDDDDDDENRSTKTAQSLRLACTDVSWNATGAVIAVAYGRFDHSGWCNYRSALCLWKVFQSDFNAAKPHTVLDAPSGLMCVAFHPRNPSLVVAGSFSGEVLLWDLKTEDYRFYSSGIGEYYHCEPVTKVAWVYDVSETEYNIASVSGDGKVLYWRLKDKLACPVEGYTLQLETSGNNTAAGTAVKAAGSDHPLVAGGKAIAFSEVERPSRAFVAGSEGGMVVRCNASSVLRSSEFKKWTPAAARLVSNLPPQALAAVRRQVEKYAADKQVKGISLATVYEAKVDPYVLYPSASDFVFAGHGGPVYDLSFSPFCRGVFLSSSADGTVRVYKTREREPLLTVEVTPTSSYLYAVSWSRTRPMVFATAAEDGHVYVYDLKIDRTGPVAVLSSGDSASPSSSGASADSKKGSSSSSKTKGASSVATTKPAMFSLDFNPRQRNFLAAGDAKGVAHIWKLPWQLANLQSGETSLLEALEDRA